MRDIVEDNASPHNNETIRQCHRDNGARIVGYTATAAEKEEIVALIRQQTAGYRREQDKKVFPHLKSVLPHPKVS